MYRGDVTDTLPRPNGTPARDCRMEGTKGETGKGIWVTARWARKFSIAMTTHGDGMGTGAREKLKRKARKNPYKFEARTALSQSLFGG